LKAENNILIFTGSTVKMPFHVMKTDDTTIVSVSGFVGATGIGIGKMMVLWNVTPCSLAERYRSIQA
jgi:hypothetical protein